MVLMDVEAFLANQQIIAALHRLNDGERLFLDDGPIALRSSECATDECERLVLACVRVKVLLVWRGLRHRSRPVHMRRIAELVHIPAWTQMCECNHVGQDALGFFATVCMLGFPCMFDENV